MTPRPGDRVRITCEGVVKFLARRFFGEVPAAVADSLNADPAAWKIHGFRLAHRSGVAVWVANGYYGVHVESNAGATLWGGVTLASVCCVSPGHWLVWSASRRVLAQNLIADLKPLEPSSPFQGQGEGK